MPSNASGLVTAGPDGVLVVGPFAPQDARRSAILRWLRGRKDVLDVDAVRSPGFILVHPRGSVDPLVRAVRDHLEAIRRVLPASPAGFPRRPWVEIIHASNGRVRFRVHGLKREYLPDLARRLATTIGVAHANANRITKTILVRFEPEATDIAALSRAVDAIEMSSLSLEKGESPSEEETQGPLWAVVYNSVLFGASASRLLPGVATGVGVAIAAVPSARRAWSAWRSGRLSVDILDLAAVTIGVGTGKHGTASFITWLLSIGDLVLAQTQRRARTAIRGLLGIGVERAWRLDGSRLESVPLERVRRGDRIVVEAGGRIPVDGVIIRGIAVLDEKALTGESRPRRRKRGDRALAASVVVEGEAVLQVERTGADTTAARIVQILESASTRPPSLQREIEAKADWLVLPTCGLAAATGIWGGGTDALTSVLITDFGTGVRIAIPTSVLATMTRAAREGILIKGGHSLERLSRVDCIMFDKTGTLTKGGARIVGIDSVGSMHENEIVRLAASLEVRQRHPVARAILSCAREKGYSDRLLAAVEGLTYSIGTGIAARVGGRTVVIGGERMMQRHGVALTSVQVRLTSFARQGVSPIFFAIDGKLEALLGYADEPRRESKDVVRALRAAGRRKIMLLSGDSRGPVEAMARRLGIDGAVAELLPEDKANVVQSLQSEGRVVAMIGDGINDAPALAMADVGVSLGGATDVAVETADVVLLSGGLARLPRAFAIADEGMRLVRRGVAMVIAPNALAMALGALSLIGPGVSAAINNGSTVLAALSGLTPLWPPTPTDATRRRGRSASELSLASRP